VVSNLLRLRWLLWLLPLAFITVLFLWPVANVFNIGLSGSWWQELTAPDALDALWFTTWQALVSSSLCLLLGIPSAYVLYRKSFRGQGFIKAVITIPLVLPTIIVAIIFSSFQKAHEFYSDIGMDFFYENSIYWIIAAHIFVNYAITVRTIGGLWATLDPSTEEAAELSGAGRLRTVVSISLPQLKPAIISAAALTFLFCFTSFGIILLLGGGQVNSIETEISVAATQYLDLTKASALAILQTLVTLLAFSISEIAAAGKVGLEQIDTGGYRARLDRRDWPAVLITAATAVGLIAIPLALLLTRAFETQLGFGFENFANLATRGDRDLLNVSIGEAALNTLRNLVIATITSVLMGLLVSYLLSRRQYKRTARVTNRLLDIFFLMPMGISSVVLGFGYLITFGSDVIPLRSSWLVLPIVQSLMALPLVIRLIYPALMSIDRSHREAAATAGANQAQTWWHIELGIIRGVVKTAIAFAMIVSIGEFGAASLLVAGDQATLSTVLYQLISRPGSTNYGMAMAVASLMIVATLLLVSATSIQPKAFARARAARRQRRLTAAAYR
jgi:thiamine transport system permease protein